MPVVGAICLIRKIFYPIVKSFAKYHRYTINLSILVKYLQIFGQISFLCRRTQKERRLLRCFKQYYLYVYMYDLSVEMLIWEK